MKRSLLVGLMVAGISSSAALANLPLGGQWYNPALAGTGEVGDGGPYYTAGLPAWVNPGGLATALVSPIMGIPGFAAFTGTVESAVYYLNGVDSSAGIGFTYRINLAANSAPRLVRGSLGSPVWAGITIADAGADGTGNTAPGKGNTTWTNGDPYFIEREATTGAPAWVFRLGTDGTTIDAGQSSALVWFETDAQYFNDGGAISLLDGGAAGAAHVLTVGVPSPQAASLGVIGVLMAGMLRRRV